MNKEWKKLHMWLIFVASIMFLLVNAVCISLGKKSDAASAASGKSRILIRMEG